jgi:hypothetical protein
MAPNKVSARNILLIKTAVPTCCPNGDYAGGPRPREGLVKKKILNGQGFAMPCPVVPT